MNTTTDTIYQAVQVPVPIPVHEDGLWRHVIRPLLDTMSDKMVFILVIYFIVLFAILVDLYTGVRRAKANNIARTSRAYRRTVNKFNRYYCLLLIASLIDFSCILVSAWEQVGFLNMPYLTWAAGVGLCLIELRSVWENTRLTQGNTPDPIEETARTLAKAATQAHDPEALIATLLKYLNASHQESTTDEHTTDDNHKGIK